MAFYISHADYGGFSMQAALVACEYPTSTAARLVALP